MAKQYNCLINAFVVGQTTSHMPERGALPLKTDRSAPPYTGQLPQYKTIKQKTITIADRSVELRVKAILPEHLIVEAQASVPDIFAPDILQFKSKLIDAAEDVLKKYQIIGGFHEEYTLYCVSGYRGDPRQFLKFAPQIVSLLKSEAIPLSDVEIKKTIDESSLQYAKDDLTVVDWDGAFIFDPQGDWQDTMDLLQVANIHLLRLRVLDEQLDQRSAKMLKMIERISDVKTAKIKRTMAELVKLRTESLMDFEHAERDIQLIGDWFAAKLYTLAKKKFYLDRWRISIREELDNLQEVSNMLADHFTVTSERRAEQVQQLLWYIQLIGWFILLYLETKPLFNQ